MTELEELERNYSAGKFKRIKADLKKFLCQHKETIKKFRDTELSSLKNVRPTNELAVKLYILQTRSINPLEEIKLELEEIEREVWYQGKEKRGKVDHNQIAEKWSRMHAPGWRDHRILAVLYVFERNKERLMKLLVE